MSFSKVVLEALIEGSSQGFHSRCQAHYPFLQRMYQECTFLQTLRLVIGTRYLMPSTQKKSCLEAVRSWRWYDWNKPDEYYQLGRWLEKKGFVCVRSAKTLHINPSFLGMIKIRTAGAVVKPCSCIREVSKMRSLQEAGPMLWLRPHHPPKATTLARTGTGAFQKSTGKVKSCFTLHLCQRYRASHLSCSHRASEDRWEMNVSTYECNSKVEAKIKAKIALKPHLFFYISTYLLIKSCKLTKEYFSPASKSKVFYCEREYQNSCKTQIAVALFQSNFYLPHGFRMCYIGMLSI